MSNAHRFFCGILLMNVFDGWEIIILAAAEKIVPLNKPYYKQ